MILFSRGTELQYQKAFGRTLTINTFYPRLRLNPILDGAGQKLPRLSKSPIICRKIIENRKPMLKKNPPLTPSPRPMPCDPFYICEPLRKCSWFKQVACFHSMSSFACVRMKKPQKSPSWIGLNQYQFCRENIGAQFTSVIPHKQYRGRVRFRSRPRRYF